MTYAELAEIRRIDKASALKLAIRRGWTRQKNNHGQMQVCVPLDWAQPPERLRDAAADRGMDGGMDLSTALAAYEDAKAAFATTLVAKDGEIEVERTRANRAEQQADAAHKRADVATALAERTLGLLAEANIRADQAEAEAASARQTADELRRADEERKGRGRWTRFRLAWRGE